jgi:hypothetical protein
MPSWTVIDFPPKISASQSLIDTIGANKGCQTPELQSLGSETRAIVEHTFGDRSLRFAFQVRSPFGAITLFSSFLTVTF